MTAAAGTGPRGVASFRLRTRAPAVSDTLADSLVTRAIVLLFVLLLFEGVARKWLFPDLHRYLYFLRDPLVVAVYALALTRGVVRPHAWLTVWAVYSVLVVVVSAVFYIVTHRPLLILAIGVRNYFLYLPLTFVVASVFDRSAMASLARVVCFFAVPVAVVSVLQFRATPGDWINLGAGGALPPRLAGDVLRTTGILASDAQHVQYILFSLACAIALHRMDAARGVTLATAGTLAAVVMMVVSGSRAVWMLAGPIVLAAAISAILGQDRASARVRTLLAAVAVVGLVAGLFATVFTDALEAYAKRNEEAQTFSMATVERIVNAFVPNWLLEETALARGIGMASTGASAALAGERGLTAGESDIDRNIAELGVLLGTPLLVLRYSFAIWLGLAALAAATRGRGEALIFAAYAVPQIAIGPVTAHTVYAHLAWMAAGLAMAAARAAQTAPVTAGVSQPAPRGRPGLPIRASRRLAAIRWRSRSRPRGLSPV